MAVTRTGPVIPEGANEIDADWLNEVLAPRHPGVRVARVARVETLDQSEVTNSHARLRIIYRERCGAPEQVFCKLLPSDPLRRSAIAQTRMGPREALFYERLAPQTDLRVPEAHVALQAEEELSFVLLLEDLSATGCTISDGTLGIEVDAAAQALEDLAGFHARFEDPSRRRSEAGWVPAPDPPSDYGSLRLKEGLEHHRDRLSDAFAEMAELYLEKHDALPAIWHQGPPTVIHGDCHLGNLFDDHGRTGFLDWGLIVVSTALRDVSYLLNLALSIDDRRRSERDLLRHYLDVRKALRAEPISFDEAFKRHRLQASYLAPACCQIVTFPDNATEQRKVFASAFLARAEAAIEDLEARDALRRYADL
jgi:hypothetical protein